MTAFARVPTRAYLAFEAVMAVVIFAVGLIALRLGTQLIHGRGGVEVSASMTTMKCYANVRFPVLIGLG